MGKLSWNNAIILSLYNINKYSRENFCGDLENREKQESLAQRIFPRLRYSLDLYACVFKSFVWKLPRKIFTDCFIKRLASIIILQVALLYGPLDYLYAKLSLVWLCVSLIVMICLSVAHNYTIHSYLGSCMFPFKPGSSSPKSAAGTPGSPSSLSSACTKSECNHPQAYKWIQCESVADGITVCVQAYCPKLQVVTLLFL